MLLVVAAFLSMASGSKSFEPTVATAEDGVSDYAIFQSAVDVFDEEGLGLSRADEDEGVVVSEDITRSHGMQSDPKSNYEVHYYAWRAEIGNGQLVLSIDCFDEYRSACGSDERPSDLVDDEPRLREEILSRAAARPR